MTVTNRDHVRSRSAFEHITVLQKAGKDDAQAYGRLALKLPFLIRSSGLAQALVFVDLKSVVKTERQGERKLAFLDDLARTVAAVTGEQHLGTRESLIQAAMLTDDPAAYLSLSRETLRAASWYKRLSTSVLGVEPGGDDQ